MNRSLVPAQNRRVRGVLTAGAVACVGLIVSSAAAAPQDMFGGEPPAMPAIDTAFTDEARNAAAVERAEALLREVAKAYRTAPTISDVARIEVITPFGPQSDSMDLVFGKGTDARLRVTGITITSLNNEVFVEIPDFTDEKYVAVPIKDGDMLAALNSVGDGFSLPLPHLTMRFSKDETPMETLLAGLGAGALEGLSVAGHRTVDERDEVLVKGSNGLAVTHINGKSRLIDRVQISFTPEDAPPGMSLLLDLAFAPRVADELAEPIVFEAGDRRRVASIEAMMQKLEIGQEAPAFVLRTLEGESIDLKELRGNVVVLDFWATWCGPCKRALPLLDEFAKWASAEGKMVKVFGVNTWEEQENDHAVRKERAAAYWNEQKFSFPTLMDLDDAVAESFGPNGIPTTFIIDPQGRIAAIHNGFHPDMVERLKGDLAKAMGEPEQKSDAPKVEGS